MAPRTGFWGVREPLGRKVGAKSLPKSTSEASGGQKNNCGRAQERPRRISGSIFTFFAPPKMVQFHLPPPPPPPGAPGGALGGILPQFWPLPVDIFDTFWYFREAPGAYVVQIFEPPGDVFPTFFHLRLLPASSLATVFSFIPLRRQQSATKDNATQHETLGTGEVFLCR